MKQLRSLILSIVFLASAGSMNAMAEGSNLNWRFFPQSQPAQKELLKLIQSGKYSQATLFWNSSLAGESFAETANGKALFSYLLSKSGAPVLAAEKLFSIKNPQSIHQTVLDLIKVELSTSKGHVQTANVRMSKRWKRVLGSNLAKSLEPKPIYGLASTKTIKELSKLLKKKSEPSSVQNQRRYQLGLAAAIQNKNSLAYNQFVRLLESDQDDVKKDDLFMSLARLSYQQGEFEAALDWYEKVPKSSPLWLESKEEQAWAYVRLDNPSAAVSQLETVTSPVFNAISGPETDFLDSFVSLMICDYQKIFKITGNFKKKHRKKILGLESLAKSSQSPLVSNVLAVVDNNPLRLRSFSKVVGQLPRDFMLDEFLQRHMQYRRAMSKERKRLAKLNKGNQELANFSADLPENSLNSILASTTSRIEKAAKEIGLRLQSLARSELKEYKLMISKLHIVEAEVIQRLHLDENLKGQRAEIENPVPKGSDVLSFPVTKEVWLDELDSYHAQVKDCPKLTRRAGL